jgi:glycosyltransferase involved in cell wall biosynthesis
VPRLPTRPARDVGALGGAARRRLPLAIAAWDAAETGVPLVVVGPREPVPSGVTHLGTLEDRDWARVLGNAAAFLWPTSYEGFGMPGLEAAAAGTPVVCARVGAVPEVLGDVPVWADGLDLGAFAAALRAAVLDPEISAAARAAGPAHSAARPGWAHTAEVHARAYRVAASGVAA